MSNFFFYILILIPSIQFIILNMKIKMTTSLKKKKKRSETTSSVLLNVFMCKHVLQTSYFLKDLIKEFKTYLIF